MSVLESLLKLCGNRKFVLDLPASLIANWTARKSAREGEKESAWRKQNAFEFHFRMQIFNRFLCCSFGLKTETKPQKQKQKQREEEAAEEETEICKWMGLSWPLSLQSELLAICAHALPWLWHGMNWIRIWIACECGTLSSWFPSPLPLLPCHAFGYETIETSLQSVHKVFTRTQNTETAAETNRQTDERAEETDGQTGGRTDWDGQQTQQKIQNCEQIVRLLWLPPSIAAVRLPGRGVWL